MKQIDLSDLTDEDLVDEPTARQILGGRTTPIHRSSMWRGVRDGRYPSPIKVGPATNRWRVGELRKAIEELAAQRHGGKAA